MGSIQDRRTVKDSTGKIIPTGYAKPWRARTRKPDGSELSKSFRTKGLAERWLRDQEHALDHGGWIDPSRGRMRYREWAEEWQKLSVHKRESTKARDASYLANHILPEFGEMPIARIEHLAVQQWVYALIAKGLAGATVCKAAHILGGSMRAAARSGLIRQSPCDGLELPPDAHLEQRFLSSDEVALLADSIDPRYRAFVLLGAYGGLRAGELLGLRVERLEPLKSAVRVCETVIEVRGKLIISEPKTKVGIRTVPIPRAVADVLVEHSAGRDADEWMFPAPKGGAMRLGLFRARFWTPAVKACGLDGLRIHDLRHTAVSFWLLTKKANAKDVATWAGHRSVATILDRYGHLLPGHEAEPMAALDAIFRAAEANKPRPGTVENLDDYRDDDDPPPGVLAVV